MGRRRPRPTSSCASVTFQCYQTFTPLVVRLTGLCGMQSAAVCCNARLPLALQEVWASCHYVATPGRLHRKAELGALLVRRRGRGELLRVGPEPAEPQVTCRGRRCMWETLCVHACA